MEAEDPHQVMHDHYSLTTIVSVYSAARVRYYTERKTTKEKRAKLFLPNTFRHTGETLRYNRPTDYRLSFPNSF